MPSHLRLQSSLEEPISAHATYRTSPTLPPAKKQKMSLTSTYYVASTARSKLGREAARADHDLHRLVSHANLLDSLMIELADAEREQEAWFNQSVRKASRPEEPRRVQWADSIPEEYDEEDESDSDDESDDGFDEMMLNISSTNPIKAAPVSFSSSAIEEDEELDYDEDSEDEELALTRVQSQSAHSPPELLEDDSDSDSEDDCPSSPEDTPLPLSEKQRKAIAATTFQDAKSQQLFQDYGMQQPQQPLIAAC